MRRFLSTLAILAIVVGGCGNSTSDAGGSGATGGGGGGGGSDLPAASTVIFGSAYDPATLGVTGKTGSIARGAPIVAVARVFTARPPAEVVVRVGSGATNFAPRPVSAANSQDQADTFAFDLTPDKLGPGTWVIAFTTAAGKILASGFLVVNP